MPYECINPRVREWIIEIAKSATEEMTHGLDSGISYGEMGEARIHWNCCPACRHEFPSLPAVLEQAGAEFEKAFAADLSHLNDLFTFKKHSILESGSDDAYLRIIVELVDFEWDVHQSLRRSLMVANRMNRGVEVEFDPEEREILSLCRGFVASLEPRVQHFVIASTLCFELLRPIFEKAAPPPDARTIELQGKPLEPSAQTTIEQAEQYRKEPGRRAIIESGFEPRVLWEIIESAAIGCAPKGDGAVLERLSQLWKRDFDDFADSMKAGQMEMIRLSEQSKRKAAQYEPEIIELIGAPLYAELDAVTRELLRTAEFLYELNAAEPCHFDGPVMILAKAYENELLLRVARPVVKELVASDVQMYPPIGRDGKKPEKALISGGRVQDRNMTTGSVAWCLSFCPDFCARIRGRGFDASAISKDAWAAANPRNIAGHEPIVERAVADRLRALILSRDGALSSLHPILGGKSKYGGRIIGSPSK